MTRVKHGRKKELSRKKFCDVNDLIISGRERRNNREGLYIRAKVGKEGEAIVPRPDQTIPPS